MPVLAGRVRVRAAHWRVTSTAAGVSWTVHDSSATYPTFAARAPSEPRQRRPPGPLHPGPPGAARADPRRVRLTRLADGAAVVALSSPRRRRTDEPHAFVRAWTARRARTGAATGAPHPSPHPLTPRRRPTSRTPRDPTPVGPRRVRDRLPRGFVRVRVSREPPEASIADPSRRASVRCGMARRGGSSVAAVRSRSRGDVGVDATPRNSTGRFHVGERRRGGVRVDAL